MQIIDIMLTKNKNISIETGKNNTLIKSHSNNFSMNKNRKLQHNLIQAWKIWCMLKKRRRNRFLKILKKVIRRLRNLWTMFIKSLKKIPRSQKKNLSLLDKSMKSRLLNHKEILNKEQIRLQSKQKKSLKGSGKNLISNKKALGKLLIKARRDLRKNKGGMNKPGKEHKRKLMSLIKNRTRLNLS